jgi:hypothetical protein
MTPRSASARTVVLLAIVLDVPVLARIVRALTPEPRTEVLDVDGVPVELVLPSGEGQWPAFHFVNGAHPERRQEPIVRRVTHGLARAGFVVALPDLPGLGEGELTPRTFQGARAVSQMLVDRPAELRRPPDGVPDVLDGGHRNDLGHASLVELRVDVVDDGTHRVDRPVRRSRNVQDADAGTAGSPASAIATSSSEYAWSSSFPAA